LIFAKEGAVAKALFSAFAMKQSVGVNAHNFRISAIPCELLPYSP
jgi:hypothetical protein